MFTWIPGVGRAKVICFIDDDPNELRRFENALKDQPSKSKPFTCVTATTYEDCIAKLKSMKLSPDLWVLDLYFVEQGHTNTDEEKEEMSDRYAELEQRVAEFRKYLTGIKQGPKEGLRYLKMCRDDHRVPVIMFTRKGTLEDSLDCFEGGAAAVLKKPMPASLTGTSEEKRAQLDRAMAEHAVYLRGKFLDAIKSNSLWWKHRGKVFFVLGVAATSLANMASNHFVGPALERFLGG